MDAKEFRLFVAQMDNLTAVQRTGLSAALRGNGPANEAIALIDMQVASALARPPSNALRHLSG